MTTANNTEYVPTTPPAPPSDAECNVLHDELRELDDFNGKIVVVPVEVLADAYKDRMWAIVQASGGSGCRKGMGGNGVFAIHAPDRSTTKFRLGQISRLASPEEIEWFTKTYDETPHRPW